MKIVECPRDAMQGIDAYIPTADKVRYINQLLKVGFDTIDFGSFVSPKAIPQMKDTSIVFRGLSLDNTVSKLLAIVANARGAIDAAALEGITYLGFPLSISETFQRRNTNKSIPEALNALQEIKDICLRKGKKLVVYISMGFGNPYGDPYHVDLVESFVDIMLTLGSDVISIADTIGVSTPEHIRMLFSSLSATYPSTELGIHLHATPDTALEKIKASLEAGCKRLDGALKGYGGCPMAKDELVGNIATEQIIAYMESKGIPTGIDKAEFLRAMQIADEIFPRVAN
ncbi:MAG TPA: hydroxymethylglutaryl-CoA lyase [Chryseolinea sp.]|nr:hydroxymethylglutaryl-CoA lyase [Chryseolinea sp.]